MMMMEGFGGVSLGERNEIMRNNDERYLGEMKVRADDVYIISPYR
jgi:hypothetical protein